MPVTRFLITSLELSDAFKVIRVILTKQSVKPVVEVGTVTGVQAQGPSIPLPEISCLPTRISLGQNVLLLKLQFMAILSSKISHLVKCALLQTTLLLYQSAGFWVLSQLFD